MKSRDDIVSERFLNNEGAVLKELNDIYVSAQDEIKDKIQLQSERISDLTEIINQLDKDDPQKVLLESERQSAVYQREFQENLNRQISGILDDLNTKQFATISDYLSKCYDEGFLGTLYSIQGQGVPLTIPINQQAVVRAIQLDSKISIGLYRKLGVDTDDLKKRIASSVSDMMVRGGNYYDVQRKIDEVAHIGFNKSFRIARTEGHRIRCTAQNDCMVDVKDRGADIVKQWSSTLDGRTRNSHVLVDMEIREIGEKFSNGLEFPGDPIAPASEVVNCRCGLMQRARMLLDRAFMKRDGFTGEIREFASPDDYNEFKKWYFSDENRAYMKHLQQLEDKYQTKNFKKVLESMTDSEYKKFKELEAKTPFFNHTGKSKLKYTFKSDVDNGQIKKTTRQLYDEKLAERRLLESKLDEANKKLEEAELAFFNGGDTYAFENAGKYAETVDLLKNDITALNKEMREISGSYAEEIQKKMIDRGLCSEVKLSSKMHPDAMDEVFNALDDMVNKYSLPPVNKVAYDNAGCKLRGGCVAYYDNAKDAICIGENFALSTSEYRAKRIFNEDAWTAYREKKSLDSLSKKFADEAIEKLNNAVSDAEKHFAKNEYNSALILRNTTRKAVSETLYDVIVHEYGHSIHFKATGEKNLRRKTPQMFGKKVLKSSGVDWNINNNEGKLLASKVSQYATETPLECFAESFVAVLKKERIPKELQNVIIEAISNLGGRL